MIIFTTFITLISSLIHGYYYNVLDHHHYLPYLNKLLDPSLYPSDYYFSQPHFSYTFFNHFLVWIKKTAGLNFAWTHLIIFLISLWFLYYAVYSLSWTLFKNRSISFLSMALFLLPKWVGGGYQTHRFYFTTRDLSTGLSLLSLNLIFNRRLWHALLLLIFTALINPTVPIPIFAYWLFVVLKPLSQKLIFKLQALVHFNTPWLKIIQARGTYSFPHLWNWTGWGNLTLISSLLVIAWLGLKQRLFGRLFKPVRDFLVICAGLFFAHIIFTALVPVPQIIQFQLVRVLNLIFILGLISFSALAYYLLNHQLALVKLAAGSALTGVYFWSLHLTGWHFIAIWLLPLILLIFKPKPQLKTRLNLTPVITAFLLCHLAVKLIAVKPQLNLPLYLHYPNPLIDLTDQQDWHDVQLWAKNNTSVESVFLTPPSLHGFRVLSQRGIVGNKKDGGLVFYSEKYAQQWQQRMNHLKNYSNFTTKDFLELNKKYQFDYILVENTHQLLDLPRLYSNSRFIVYKI